MAPPRTQYARSGDVELAFQVFGEGDYDVVLVLDWASHLEELWEQPLTEEFLHALGRFARVLWFDMRGVGMSDPVPGGAAAPEDWVEDVAAVMDAASCERATLFAQGHAVQMALMAATTHPERVSSLVLYNGFARLARDDDYPAGMPSAALDPLLDLIGTQWGTGTLATALAPSVADRPGVREWWGRVERFAGTPRTAVAKARAIYELDPASCFRSSPFRRSSSTLATTRTSASVTAAISRSTSPVPDFSSCRAPTIGHCPIALCSARSRSSSPGRGRP